MDSDRDKVLTWVDSNGDKVLALDPNGSVSGPNESGSVLPRLYSWLFSGTSSQ